MMMDKVFGTTAEEIVSAQKEKYEKPTLAVVRFMFENDITWGSFEQGNQGEGGDNEISDDDWWNDWWN